MRPKPPADQQWLGRGPASRLLGVSEATLRRWSDSGRLKAFMTPGGHRRSRAALERLLPSSRDRRPPVVAAALTPARLSRAYRRDARGVTTTVPWLPSLEPAETRSGRSIGPSSRR